MNFPLPSVKPRLNISPSEGGGDEPAGPILPVKPVVSLLLARQDLLTAVVRHLSVHFGPPDLVGPWWPFTATEYYTPEMAPVGRLLVSFLHLADPAQLANWKVFTNSIEARLSLGSRRTVNLDPGYVTKERVVLATGKNFSHRIYLDHGIFGDLTLIYGQGAYQAQPWTFPDYAKGPLSELLLLVRKKYLWQLKAIAD